MRGIYASFFYFTSGVSIPARFSAPVESILRTCSYLLFDGSASPKESVITDWEYLNI